jgi:hypothetical protein
MNFKVRLFAIGILFCLSFWPKASFADTCSTTSLNNVLGTTCSIGKVSFAFTANSFTGVGVAADSIIFTPDAGNPLDPGFFLSGPFRVTATGLGESSTESFSFFWMPAVLDTAFQITGATSLLINPVVPQAPNLGFISGGNNLGFTNATVQTGEPVVNPSTATISQSLLTFPDGYFGAVTVVDGAGNGATASVDAMKHQYNLTAVPVTEPSNLALLVTSLLCMVGLKSKKLLA